MSPNDDYCIKCTDLGMLLATSRCSEDAKGVCRRLRAVELHEAYEALQLTKIQSGTSKRTISARKWKLEIALNSRYLFTAR